MSAQEHGHTLANWTGVTISFIGFCIGGVALVADQIAIMVVGLVIAALGGVVGKALSLAGKGQVYNARGARDPRADAIEKALKAAEKRRSSALAGASSSAS